MFNNDLLDNWLDTKATQIITALGEGKPLTPEEMMVLVLKAQTNHFSHLDIDMRQDMKVLREDFIADRKAAREEFTTDIKVLREDMNKRFEQVDKRFEQIDKRFEILVSRIDSFMVWSFASTLTVGGLVVAAIKFLPA